MRNRIIKFLIILILIVFNKNSIAQNFVTSEDSSSIVNQLNSLFGQTYEISDAINIDSVANKFTDIKYKRISNPYSLLDNCIVFTAHKSESEDENNSILGIYKNNLVVWYSEFILPPFVKNGKIYAIFDLINDGKVEILTCWEIANGRSYTSNLWIHSWDGQQGITRIDNLGGETPISSVSSAGFDFIDYEGDGVWEIVGYGLLDNSKETIPEVFYWDGVKYSLSEYIQLDSMEKFFVRNKFDANISVKVSEINNKLIFRYTLYNLPTSKQYINKFDVYGEIDTVNKITMPNSWVGYTLSTEIAWEDSTNRIGFSMKYKIKPSQTLSGFSYETDGLPIIGYSHLRGYNYDGFFGSDEDTRVDDYINNSVIVKTIAAKLPPSPFVPSDFIDTLNFYTESSNTLGWIQDEQTRDKYKNYLNNAKNYLTQNNNSAAKSELQKVLADCNTDSSTILTSEAYALLYFNTEYLIEQIPDSAPEVPIEFDPIAFVDTLLNYNTQCLNNGWLSATWVHTVLKSSLDNARLMLTLNQPQSSLQIMEQFNTLLDSYKTSNFVTTEGYNLLKPNSDFLIAKLDSILNAPQNVEAFVLLDTVLAANETCNTEGWYSATWVYTNLTAILNNAKITLEQNNPIGCKGVMDGFLAILEAYKTSGFVTDEGYNLLKPKCLELITELSN